MKKAFLAVLLFVLTLFIYVGVATHAAELPTYTYIEPNGEGTAVFVLTDETSGKVTVTISTGETVTGDFTYAIDGNTFIVLTVNGKEIDYGRLAINADNTLTELPPEPEIIEEEKEPNAIIEWIKSIKIEDFKAILATVASVIGTTGLTLLGMLITGVIKLLRANRKEEEEQSERQQALDKLINIGEKNLARVEAENEKMRTQLIDYINSLDTAKRKEAIEASAAIQDNLNKIIEGVKLEE